MPFYDMNSEPVKKGKTVTIDSIRPSYYVCGAGSDIDCENWDDVEGCMMYCTEFGGEGCTGTLKEEVQE